MQPGDSESKSEKGGWKMPCITLTIFEIARATTRFTRAADYSVCWPSIEEETAETRTPLMNWVRGHRRKRQKAAPDALEACLMK
jgi:hypothetical protein